MVTFLPLHLLFPSWSLPFVHFNEWTNRFNISMNRKRYHLWYNACICMCLPYVEIIQTTKYIHEEKSSINSPIWAFFCLYSVTLTRTHQFIIKQEFSLSDIFDVNRCGNWIRVSTCPMCSPIRHYKKNEEEEKETLLQIELKWTGFEWLQIWVDFVVQCTVLESLLLIMCCV